MDKATEEWIKKYPLDLQERIKKLIEKQDKYMEDDSVSPIYGTTKSRLDLHDAELSQDMAKFDFLSACRTGDLAAVKQILKRFKKEYAPAILNCTDEDGMSGLDYSIELLYPELERYLVKMGATGTKKTAILREEAARKVDEIQSGSARSVLD